MADALSILNSVGWWAMTGQSAWWYTVPDAVAT